MTALRNATWWLWCWSCWRAYTWLPWAWVRGRFGLWLLPWAGMYAYSDTWADFCDCVERNTSPRTTRADSK